MRIVCWQTILMKYHTLFFRKLGKMSQNLSSAVIGALRDKSTARNNLTFKIIFTCTWHIYLYLAYFGNILAQIQLALYILFPPVQLFSSARSSYYVFRLPIFQIIGTQIRMLTKSSLIRPRGYRTIFVLNSSEHKISTAHKNCNAEKDRFFMHQNKLVG